MKREKFWKARDEEMRKNSESMYKRRERKTVVVFTIIALVTLLLVFANF